MKLAVLTVGDRELVATLTDFPVRLHAQVVQTMTRLGIRLQNVVKSGKLSGQVLRTRTGHLRASITAATEATPTGVTTRVGIFAGPTVIYGRAHEFGVHKEVAMRAHLRTIREAFGRPIAPTPVQVSAHSRRMDMPERSFLRTALADFGPTITAVLERTAGEAARA